MKQYIALEDVNKPQATIITKADIINEFVNAYMMQDGIDCSECDRDDDYCCLRCFRDRYFEEMESEE